MRIAIFGKSIDEEGINYINLLTGRLREAGCTLLFYKPFSQKTDHNIVLSGIDGIFDSHEELKNNADFLFSIGGDGTLLDTITLVRDSGIPVLGINLGRLGFLSSISKTEILPAIDNILAGNYSLESRTLVYLQTAQHLFGELNFALNELSVTKTENNSLAKVEVWIDDVFLNTYWADGLIIATPTGSTAYSLSCFGPIITPGSQNFVITPIASHNLTVRPIVIPDKSRINIRFGGRNHKYLVGLDARFQTIDHTVELEITRAPFNIQLIQLNNRDFYSTIREKLLWGKDHRN